MSLLTWVLFESTAALGALLGIVVFVLLVYWRRSGNARPLLIGLAIAVILLVVQGLVVTQREHASRILAAIEADLVKSRTDALAAALAPEFRVHRWDRRDFVNFARERLNGVSIRWIERTGLTIDQSSSDRFTVIVGYTAAVMLDKSPYTPRSTWSLTFTRTPQGWKIVDIQPVSIDGLPNASWRSIEHTQL